MIKSLRGEVLQVKEDTLELNVSGFGMEIYSSKSVLENAVSGEICSVLTLLVITEAGPSLYGFSSEEERTLFRELTQIKNIGGRMAIALLRAFSSQEIISAVLSEDSAYLGRAQGVGAKRAERVCFELKPKIEKIFGSLGSLGEGTKKSPSTSGGASLAEALTSLGFSQQEAAWALKEARKNKDEKLNDEETLLAALSSLERRRQ